MPILRPNVSTAVSNRTSRTTNKDLASASVYTSGTTLGPPPTIHLTSEDETRQSTSAHRSRLNALASATAVSRNTHTSSFGVTIQDTDSLFSPIKGPIMFQTTVHYFYFLIIVGLARNTQWVTNIRPYNIFIYFNVFVLTMELSRMLHVFQGESMWPLYMSLVNFALLMGVCREAHMMVAALWYSSLMIIHLQSGNHQLRRHLLLFSGLFVAVYVVMLVFLRFFYIDKQDGAVDCSASCGDALEPPISWWAELTFVCGILILVLSYTLLERFIKNYAHVIVESEKNVEHLREANEELKRELVRLQTENEQHTEAPLERVLGILRQMKEDVRVDEDLRHALDEVATDLADANQDLYAPNLDTSAVDDVVVKGYLDEIFQKNPHNDKKGDLTARGIYSMCQCGRSRAYLRRFERAVESVVRECGVGGGAHDAPG